MLGARAFPRKAWVRSVNVLAVEFLKGFWLLGLDTLGRGLDITWWSQVMRRAQ